MLGCSSIMILVKGLIKFGFLEMEFGLCIVGSLILFFYCGVIVNLFNVGIFMKIVLIIGCLFGFGFEVVCYFFVCDWVVVVIMCMLGDSVLLFFDCLCVMVFDVMDE